MSKPINEAQLAEIAALLVAAGLQSLDDIDRSNRKCKCMPPAMVRVLEHNADDRCARPSCTLYTVTPDQVRVLRLHKRGAVCPTVHAIEVSYCSARCRDLDAAALKESNPNTKVAGI